MKDKLKFVSGLVILLLVGFCLFCLFTGFGMLIALVLKLIPLWQVSLGSFLCGVGYLWYAVTK